LHQFLIQWIDDEIEVVHADASAYIALADATDDWQHESTQRLSEKDLSGYDFLSVSKDGFVPVSAGFRNSARRCSFLIGTLKNVEWLRPRIGQYRSTMNDMSKAIGDIGFKCTKNLVVKGV
jgi:hypothetical protein